MEHYKEQLSAYLHHELPKEERQLIAEHLLQCEDCRAEHDEIKLGMALASNLQRADAPQSVWNRIENELDNKSAPKVSLLPNFSFSLATACALILVGVGFLTVIYFSVWQNIPTDSAKGENQPKIEQPLIVNQNTNVETPETPSNTNTNQANQNANIQPVSPAPNQSPNQISNRIQTPQQISKPTPSPSVKPLPSATAPKVVNTPKPVEITEVAAWKVETLAGNTTNELAVGETLETDANSRARVQVANIGNVEIAPNSRVKLVRTQPKEHRLSLERGLMKAKIDAPPRLFIVDTPSAVAVDLGCEYTLEVDKAGNSKLHVTLGYVALERGGRESIVPAGAMAVTKKGKGIGTPFSDDTSPVLQNALYKFDFENGGSEALQTIIKEAGLYDSITLWHLLSRTPKAERAKIFDALETLVKPSAEVTREGILRLDKKMLKAWWKEIENIWFG